MGKIILPATAAAMALTNQLLVALAQTPEATELPENTPEVWDDGIPTVPQPTAPYTGVPDAGTYLLNQCQARCTCLVPPRLPADDGGGGHTTTEEQATARRGDNKPCLEQCMPLPLLLEPNCSINVTTDHPRRLCRQVCRDCGKRDKRWCKRKCRKGLKFCVRREHASVEESSLGNLLSRAQRLAGTNSHQSPSYSEATPCRIGSLSCVVFYVFLGLALLTVCIATPLLVRWITAVTTKAPNDNDRPGQPDAAVIPVSSARSA